MANIHQFDQNVRTRFGKYGTDIGDTDLVSTEYVDMKNYDLIVGVAIASDIASGSIVTLTMYQATGTAGEASAAVSSSVATSTASADELILVAQVRGEDLSTTTAFHYVGWIVDSNDSTNTTKGAGVLHQMRARYKQATLPA